MVRINYIFLVMFVFCRLFISCKESGKNDIQNTPEEKNGGKYVFELPEIPVVYTTDKSRNAFLAVHYWDRFDFGDTVLYRQNEEVEQAFANYLQVLTWVSPEVVAVSVDSLLGRAWKADSIKQCQVAYDYFTRQLEHYLYEPDSPMRNDELYLIVLKRILHLSGPEPILKVRPSYQYEELMRNRAGTPATHLSYVTHTGQAGSLYKIKTDYVLLYFYDPDCPACQQTEPLLAKSGVICEMIRKKKLTLLALYTDQNVELWREHVRKMPGEWLHAYDKKMEILHRGTYSLRALPQLYLLDKDKKVMIKDGTFRQIEDALIKIEAENNNRKDKKIKK